MGSTFQPSPVHACILLTRPELVDVVGPEVGGAPDVNIAGEVAVEPALLPMKLEMNTILVKIKTWQSPKS